MELDYNNIFQIVNFCMRINRSHPEIKRDIKWLIYFILTYGFSFLVLLTFVYNILDGIKNTDFLNTFRIALYAIVGIVTAYKYIVVVWKQNSLKYLIETVKEDYHNAGSLTFEDRKIMSQYAKETISMSRKFFLIWFSTFVAFPLKHLYFLAYYWAKGTPKFVPMLDIIYPGVIEKYKENLYVYPFIYCNQIYFGLYCVNMYTAFTPLGPSFILHACAQLEIIERKLYGLFKNDVRVVDATLKEVVIQMQKIYRFVEHIENSIRIAYELILRVHSIMLPVAVFEILECMKEGEFPVEFMNFVIGSMIMCSVPCFYCERLLERSESFRLAVYSCGWETVFNRSSRATILVILTRATKPIAIRTLFRTITLEYLADLSRQSYTIFSLMNAMWN